jgi:hypothetical protein
MIASIRWDGAPVRAPGIYHDMPLARYHQGDAAAGPSVSSTTLRRLWNESPAHAWAHDPANPNRVVDDDSEAFILGRATHHLICGQAGFSDEFIVRPTQAPDGRDWHGSNKSCIKWTAEQKRIGRTVLTSAHVEQIKGMAIALGAHPLVQAGILNGLIERSLFWQDKETGLWLKARPDAIPSDSGDFADLKTTESVLYHRLQNSIATYGYHQQAALVLEGARALDLPAETFTLIWVESKKPHCARAQQIKDEDIARGTKQNRAAIRMFADCLAAGSWPGPGDDRPDAEFVDLPDWKRKQIDERLKLELREAA